MANKHVIQLAQQIDALLPQTQCGKCGYPGCKPYAQAIAEGAADINQCPPGGDANIHRLAALTQMPYRPLNPENGQEKPRQRAVIDEQVCIGCTLCIQACPVDAIVGAAKQMHTVIVAECTGCELCVAPCPVDCISMVDAPPPTVETSPAALQQKQADHARYRYEFRLLRLEREKQERTARLAAKAVEAKAAAARLAEVAKTDPAAAKAALDKQAIIQAALARAAAKKAAAAPPADNESEKPE